MKEQRAALWVEVYVYCPECEAHIDLLDCYNDEGEVMSQVCPDDGHWRVVHKDFKIKGVNCGECDCEFVVKGLDY